MYMCHDAIRKTILHKFNEVYPDWKCETEEQLYNNVSRIDIKDANDVVNSVKICDLQLSPCGWFQLFSIIYYFIIIKIQSGYALV